VGGPDDDTAPTIKSAGVVIETDTLGASRFYKLEIRPEFFRDGISALRRTIETIEAALAVHPDFRHG
jgi:hypothetical protein